MDEFTRLLGVTAFLSHMALAGPALDQAEVRLPYGELKALVEGAVRPVGKKVPDAALLSARFRLTMVADKLVLDSSFRTTSFSDDIEMIPLVGGNVSVESQEPEEARILIREAMLCQAVDKQATGNLEVRLLPVAGKDGTMLVVPACPAAVFETADLGDDRSIELKMEGKEVVVGSNASVALPIAGGAVEFRMLGGEETREALRPPQPSVWTWQHQALVIPGEGDLSYRVAARASSSAGSGVGAILTLPADAREIRVAGQDLAAQKVVRNADRSQGLNLEWRTRGLLERELTVFYKLPRRPLDRQWKLHAPAAPDQGGTGTRFIVAGAADLSYSAQGLVGPFQPKGLPAGFADDLGRDSCYQLEGEASVELGVNPLPLVATAEATIGEAVWSVKLEPDGAMLVEGMMAVEHRGMSGVAIDVPEGMALLACQVGGKAMSPVDRGNGRLEIHLSAADEKTSVSCSFTGKAAAFDPMEGTLELALPKTPLFIRALIWKIDLPKGYQAETHGNLVRVTDAADPPSRMTLRKNLCRDERPQTNVFYQRSDRNP